MGVNNLMRFDQLKVGHSFVQVCRNGSESIPLLKVSDERTGRASLDRCSSNILILDRNHWGVVSDRALVRDLGVIEEDWKQWRDKVDSEK